MFELPVCSRLAWARRLAFSVRNAASLIVAPLIPFGGLALCGLMLAGFGLLYWVPVVGNVLGGLLFAIPLGHGCDHDALGDLLAAGWPLLQAAVAAGAEDALDAVEPIVRLCESTHWIAHGPGRRSRGSRA